MLSLSQTAGYALMALSCLDAKGEAFVMEKDIAEKTGISKPYLSKILHRLGQAGLIITKRGYKGGIQLARPAEEISVLEVTDLVEGPEWRSKCLMGMPVCGSQKPCPLHEFWLMEKPKIENKLANLSLKQLIEFQKQGWRIIKKVA